MENDYEVVQYFCYKQMKLKSLLTENHIRVYLMIPDSIVL